MCECLHSSDCKCTRVIVRTHVFSWKRTEIHTKCHYFAERIYRPGTRRLFIEMDGDKMRRVTQTKGRAALTITSCQDGTITSSWRQSRTNRQNWLGILHPPGPNVQRSRLRPCWGTNELSHISKSAATKGTRCASPPSPHSCFIHGIDQVCIGTIKLVRLRYLGRLLGLFHMYFCHISFRLRSCRFQFSKSRLGRNALT